MIINWIVQSWKIVFPEDDNKRYKRWLAMKEDWSVIRIEATKQHFTRSIKQNAYYHWCVVEPLRQYLGIETAELMHEVLKHEHLSTSIRLPFDRRKKIKVVTSTTEMSTVEFETFIENVRKWARIKLRFEIPLPNNSPYPYDPNEWTTKPSTSSP